MSKEVKVFCIDDEKEYQQTLIDILNDYDCVAIESGSDCIEALKKSIPDLILMDVKMPGMDGFETCEKLRSVSEYHDIPVIFLSGDTSLEAKLKGYSAGGDDFIAKPFEQEELVAKVKATLKRKLLLNKAHNEIARVKSSSDELTETLGEMGAVVYFLQSILNVKSYEVLAKKIIEAHESLALEIAIELMHDDERHYYGSDNIANPLEECAFEFVRDKGRLHDFGEHTAVNFPTVSIIVRNMPIHNTDLHGRIRDHIAIIAQGAHTKIEELGNALAIQDKYQTVIQGITGVEHSLINLDYAIKHPDDTSLNNDMSEQINTLLAEVNEIVAGSSLDEYIEEEDEEEAVEAVVFF